MHNEQPIYKILTEEEWSVFQATQVFVGAPVDKQDGYIHFSTCEQVEETANRHFSQHASIWLLKVDTHLLQGELRWEPSRGGELFPHLYDAPLEMAAVKETRRVQMNESGTFMID